MYKPVFLRNHPSTFFTAQDNRKQSITVHAYSQAEVNPSSIPPQNGAPGVRVPPSVDPDECTAEMGSLIAINRSRPMSEADIYRCTACTKPECAGPSGCAEYQWRDIPGGYLKEILTAKVYAVSKETPLEYAPHLSSALNNTILLKREDLQPVRSFKIRGAFNRMARLSPTELQRGVICSSAGNHAQGVAMSAAKLGCRAIVCMPRNSPEIKRDAVAALGAEVELVGETFIEAMDHARERAIKEGLVFVNAYDDPLTIAGQGTIGHEIIRQTDPDELDAIFVAMGGGGMIAGIAAAVKSLFGSKIKIFGVEPYGCNSMTQSLVRGERVSLSRIDQFADGVAVGIPGRESFRLCRDLVDACILVDNAAISAAIKDVFNETRTILEPSGAVALAGLKAYVKKYDIKDKKFAAVTSGSNMNFDRLRLVLDLADVGSGETMLAVCMSDEDGAIVQMLSCAAADHLLDVTELKYRISGDGQARVLLGVGVSPGTRPMRDMVCRLTARGWQVLDLSSQELAQVHLRQMVGGVSKGGSVPDERFFWVQYPERTGMLRKLLSPLTPRWNITLLNFRKSGGRTASALLGLQVPDCDLPEFDEALKAANLSIEFNVRELTGETKDAFKLFLE